MALLIIIAIYFLVNVVMASLFVEVAYAKGYDNNAHAFAMCFWLGIMGCIYVASLPDLIAREQRNNILKYMESSKKDDETDDNNLTLEMLTSDKDPFEDQNK